MTLTASQHSDAFLAKSAVIATNVIREQYFITKWANIGKIRITQPISIFHTADACSQEIREKEGRGESNNFRFNRQSTKLIDMILESV